MVFHKIVCYSSTAMLLVAGPLEARMYQWVNPDSGYTQFSGKPPAWYRGEASGPRVLVFERGRLIDDTVIKVSGAQREALRTQAFQLAEQHRPLATTPEVELDTSAESAMSSGAIPSGTEDKFAPDIKTSKKEGKDTMQAAAEKAEAKFMEGLKKIIADWDKRKEEEAKRLLGTRGNLDQAADQPQPPVQP